MVATVGSLVLLTSTLWISTADAAGRAPTVSIGAPSDGEQVSGSIEVSGQASDDQEVRAVHVIVDDRGPRAARGTTSWAYSFDTDRLSAGTHTITAVATDRQGNDGVASITIVVGDGDGGGDPEPQAVSGAYFHKAPAALGVWSDRKDGHTDAKLEGQIGRKFAGVRNNQRIFEPVPAKDEVSAFDGGRRYSIRNARPNRLVNGRLVATCWKDWANGKYDSTLKGIVDALKADRRWSHSDPYLFAFAKEMNIDNATTPHCGTPEEYKAAARHVFTYLQNAGVLWRTGGKVVIAWVPSGSAFRNGTAKNYDPNLGSNGRTIVGDFYDLVGIDIYDRVESGGHLKTTDPHWLFDPGHEYAVARGKQLIIPEFGVDEDRVNDGVNEKAQVFSRVVSVLASYGTTGPGSVAAVFYTNAGGDSPGAGYWPDTSAAALAAFKTMARSSFFGG
jgi:hypothetical protein